MGALPEGFCPVSMQELGEAIVGRIIASTGQNFSTFVVGPNAPTSNIGPWLKNCEEWFVWSDESSSYVPIRKGGFDEEQLMSSSGTFVVPAFIYQLRVSAWGGGGGGGASGGGAGGGGGGGAFSRFITNVTPGQAITVTIGAGGTSGANGGNTTVLTLVAGGGGGGVSGGGSGAGGLGGVAAGGTLNFNGQSAPEGEPSAGAMGGSSPQGGGGGNTDFALNRSAVYNGTFPGGGGGGGAVGATEGSGAGGAALFEW